MKKPHEAWNWFALLAVTILVNVPMLSPRLVFANDTLHNFVMFQYAYGELFFHNDFPRWIPAMGYGIPFDMNLLDSMQPSHFVMMGVGWLLGMRDAMLLFKLSMILSQAFLLLGLFLFARKLCASMLSVWMICLGGILTTTWMYNCTWGLTTFYLLPLVLWLLLLYVEKRKARHLWTAALIEAVSLMGTVAYIAPVHLLILTTFLLPFLCRETGLFWSLANWRTFVHPLFFVFVGFLAMLGVWAGGMEVLVLSPSRDRATGNVPLDVFLNYGRQPLTALTLALVKGDFYYSEYTNYVGTLPLLILAFALPCRRDTPFLSLAAVAFVLVWFTLGGWFDTLLYNCFPLMKKYRFISITFATLKIFLLLLAGLGFDRLLQTVRGTQYSVLSTQYSVLSQSVPLTGREKWVVILLVLCCGADFVANHRVQEADAQLAAAGRKGPPPDSSAEFWFQQQDKPHDYSRQSAGPVLLIVRYLICTAALLVLWFNLSFRDQTRARWARLTGPILLAAYLADVGLFFSQVVKQGPYCPPDVQIDDALDIRPLTFRPQRFADRLEDLPAEARKVYDIVYCVRGGSAREREHNTNASVHLLMHLDLSYLLFRLDVRMPGIQKMGQARASPLLDVPFKKSLGEHCDSMRIVSDVVFADNEQQALAIFGGLANPHRKLVIIGKPPPAGTASKQADGFLAELDAGTLGFLGAPQGQGALLAASAFIAAKAAGEKVEVTFFSANRVVVKVPAHVSGWLYYADAIHSGWKAQVDGQPAEVRCANIGFKAVYLPPTDGATKGEESREVVFYFEDGWRGRLCLGIVLSTAVIAFGLTALLFAAPWLASKNLAVVTPPLFEHKADIPGRPLAANLSPAPIGEQGLTWLAAWSGLAWLTTFAVLLFLFSVSLPLTLGVTAVAGLFVLFSQRGSN